MDERIYEKLNGIKDLNDRILLKKIMNSVFEALEEYSEERFEELEKRVFNEVPYIKENYNIYSTMVKKENYDETSEFMYPMLKEDTEEKIFNTLEILEALEGDKAISMFKIFMKSDYLVFKEFINSEANIKGIIKTNKKTHKAIFKIEKNQEYADKIVRLYKSFINSNIAWTTVNNPYIHKIANVVLLGVEDKIEQDENITAIEVEFGEYKKFIEYNMVPLWNVKTLNLKCNGFPMPCIDRVGYEHEVSIAKEGRKNGYLVDCENEFINFVTFTKKSVIISANSDKVIDWKLWCIVARNKNQNEKYEYEVMTNNIKVNFANKLAFEKPFTIKTKTELSRVINSYEASKYIRFNDVSLKENYPEEIKETYDVNDFIIDEIREDNIKKALVLSFEAIDKEEYLNKDILSFLVSEVQFLYPEYKCEGRLI